jgi:hypothetical protein
MAEANHQGQVPEKTKVNRKAATKAAKHVAQSHRLPSREQGPGALTTTAFLEQQMILVTIAFVRLSDDAREEGSATAPMVAAQSSEELIVVVVAVAAAAAAAAAVAASVAAAVAAESG